MQSWFKNLFQRSPEHRARIAQRRRAYWDAPLDTPLKRAHAWVDMLIRDHGLIRLAYPNRFELDTGVIRSSQPSPGQIAAFAAQGGRAIMTLRGSDYRGSLALERDAAKRHGLSFLQWRAKAGMIVTGPEILKLIELLQTIEKPVLIHCKSGADRMGFVAVIYAHVVMKQPIEVAREQLSLRYGHLRASRTGVLDLFFDAYERAHRQTGIGLADWIETEADIDAINRSHRKGLFAGLFEQYVLRREI